MNPKTKNLIALFLFSAASVTLLFALPHPRHPSRTPKRPSGSSILLDNTFNAPFFATQVPPGRGVLLPDGKYVLFANIDTAADHATGPIIRYNADGSFDKSFSFSRDYAGVFAVAATSDGNLIVTVSQAIYGVGDPFQHQVNDVLRLIGDGSIDPTFGPAQATDGGEIRVLKVNNDGTIFVAGLFTEFNNSPRQGIVRLLANGTVDSTFAPVTMTCPQFPFFASGCGVAAEPVVDADGKIIIAGDFIAVNGVSRTCVARLNADGTLDTTFNPSGFTPYGFSSGTPFPIRGVAIQSDGKIVIGGRFSGGNCNNQVPLVRLNTDGSRDNNYIYTECLPHNENGQYGMRNLVKDANDRIIAVDYSMWRFNTDGSLDPDPIFHNPVFAFSQHCCYEAFNVAFADGGTRLFVGGGFSDVDDVGVPSNGERWGAAKFSAVDGSLDTSFTTSGRTGYKIQPNSFLRHADGFTLISFARFQLAHYPPISHAFGRLFSTGALDLTFDPIASFDPNGPLGPNFVSSGFTPFSDGSLLVTGENGVTANYGRLLPDSSEDPSFHGDPNVSFANAIPRVDGKVVVSQYDPAFNDPNRPASPNAQAAVDGTEVQRINTTGSVDTAFQLDPLIVADTLDRDSGNLTNVYVGSGVLALTLNNTVLFGYLSKDGSYHLVHLNNDGSLDASFEEQTFPVSMSFIRTQVNDPGHGSPFVNMYYPDDIPVKQAKNVLDNKVVLMGSFARYGGVPPEPAHGMMRIKPDGSFDPDFSVGDGAQWVVTPETEFRHPSVDNLEVGLNDKLLLTGTFEAFYDKNTLAPGIISLNPDGTVDPEFVAPVNREIYDYQPAYLKRQPDGSFLLSGPYSAGNGYSPSFFRLLLPPGVPTPPGTDVTVDLGGNGGADDITVTFDAVQNSGTTSAELIDPEWAGELPEGYQIVGADLAFEIWTTATYTLPVTVCFDLSSLDPATFAAARIFHNDGTGLVDVTSSKDPATQTICGDVNSLSPFIVLRPTRSTPSPRPRPTPHPRPTPRH